MPGSLNALIDRLLQLIFNHSDVFICSLTTILKIILKSISEHRDHLILAISAYIRVNGNFPNMSNTLAKGKILF